MRLIDADGLMDSLRGNVLIDVVPELEETIAQQPTAFDKESVLSEMTKKYEDAINMYSMDIGTAYSFSSSVRKETWGKAIDIVEKGGIE
jgi:hypothetical protein